MSIFRLYISVIATPSRIHRSTRSGCHATIINSSRIVRQRLVLRAFDRHCSTNARRSKYFRGDSLGFFLQRSWGFPSQVRFSIFVGRLSGNVSNRLYEQCRNRRRASGNDVKEFAAHPSNSSLLGNGSGRRRKWLLLTCKWIKPDGSVGNVVNWLLPQSSTWRLSGNGGSSVREFLPHSSLRRFGGKLGRDVSSAFVQCRNTRLVKSVGKVRKGLNPQSKYRSPSGSVGKEVKQLCAQTKSVSVSGRGGKEVNRFPLQCTIRVPLGISANSRRFWYSIYIRPDDFDAGTSIFRPYEILKPNSLTRYIYVQ